ncbi:MAG: hypothetical protein JNK84_08180 [Phreatobacter sp.]|uniref:hypothetical protein n=1 Tax=Phreatobacter sp. TaxID=1966341 RepID=UPI001A3A3E76|nr:hypothetical protein [Phreatobacter sp.]MBL8569049.1 hypothetical protein [Phreatobacter sp.]
MSLVGQSASASLTVTVTAEALAGFARGIGASGSGQRRPTTFPISWLTQPAVVDAVRQMAADRPASLPVHELQTIETLAEAPLGQPLMLTATATRTDADRITLQAVLADAGGASLTRLHAILRLVP